MPHAPRPTPLSLVALAVALLAGSAGSALAADDGPTPEARIEFFNHHVKAALRFRDAGQLDEALDAFDAALGSIRSMSGEEFDEGRARVLYHKALLLMRLDRLEEARAVLQVLRDSPGVAQKERDTIAQELANAERRLAEAREAAAAPEPTPEPEPAAEPAPTPRVEVTLVAPEPRSGTSPFAIAGWLTAGCGLAITAAAVGVHVSGVDDVVSAGDPDTIWREADELDAAGRTKLDVATSLYVIGGAAIGTGLVLLLIAPGESSDPPPVVALTPTDGGLGLYGALSF